MKTKPSANYLLIICQLAGLFAFSSCANQPKDNRPSVVEALKDTNPAIVVPDLSPMDGANEALSDALDKVDKAALVARNATDKLEAKVKKVKSYEATIDALVNQLDVKIKEDAKLADIDAARVKALFKVKTLQQQLKEVEDKYGVDVAVLKHANKDLDKEIRKAYSAQYKAEKALKVAKSDISKLEEQVKANEQWKATALSYAEASEKYVADLKLRDKQITAQNNKLKIYRRIVWITVILLIVLLALYIATRRGLIKLI